jgi:hypothetical protein
MNLTRLEARQMRRAYPRTVGDCPDFAVPWEQNGTVPLSETVLELARS